MWLARQGLNQNRNLSSFSPRFKSLHNSKELLVAEQGRNENLRLVTTFLSKLHPVLSRNCLMKTNSQWLLVIFYVCQHLHSLNVAGLN